jgi:hypothetical protein
MIKLCTARLYPSRTSPKKHSRCPMLSSRFPLTEYFSVNTTNFPTISVLAVSSVASHFGCHLGPLLNRSPPQAFPRTSTHAVPHHFSLHLCVNKIGGNLSRYTFITCIHNFCLLKDMACRIWRIRSL